MTVEMKIRAIRGVGYGIRKCIKNVLCGVVIAPQSKFSSMLRVRRSRPTEGVDSEKSDIESDSRRHQAFTEAVAITGGNEH